MELVTTQAVAERGAKWWKAENRERRLTTMLRDAEKKYEDIAADLGCSVGKVCAKASRLGLGRGRPEFFNFWSSKLISTPKGPPDPIYREIAARQEREAIYRGGATIALVNSEEHHCRFVIGDPAHGRICGARRKSGLPYCEEHAGRCSSRWGHEARDYRSGAQQPQPRRMSAFSQRTSDGTANFFPVDPRNFEIIDAADPAPA